MFESGGGFMAGIAYPLPSFPRKRESRGGLPRMRRHKAAPFGIPAYAGMTVVEPQATYYVIPSVAEESKNLERSQGQALTGWRRIW